MNFTRALYKGFGLRGVALAVLVAGAMAVFSGTTTSHASDDLSGPLPLEAPMPPQQQDGQELDGESELPWLFAVFFITWAAFFAYVFIMSRRQREMQREIQALKRAMAEREQKALQVEQGSESRGS